MDDSFLMSVLMILFGLIGGNAVLAWLHFAETNHSPRRDLISAYAHSRFPKTYAFHNFTFVVAGVGAAMFTHRYLPHSLFLPLLCLIYSLGIAVLAIFPMDISAQVKTVTGALHVLGVVLVFGAATFYSLILSHLGSNAGSNSTKTLFDFTSGYLVVGIMVLLIAQARRWTNFGLIERVAAAGLSLWLISILTALR